MTAAEALEQLTAREPIFHVPELGQRREDLERLTAPDYWEVGASGRIYSRAYVIDMLLERYASGLPEQELAASDFACRQLGPDCWLLTYNLLQDGVRRTRRATVWEHVGGDWRIVYHQGTVVV